MQLKPTSSRLNKTKQKKRRNLSLSIFNQAQTTSLNRLYTNPTNIYYTHKTNICNPTHSRVNSSFRNLFWPCYYSQEKVKESSATASDNNNLAPYYNVQGIFEQPVGLKQHRFYRYSAFSVYAGRQIKTILLTWSAKLVEDPESSSWSDFELPSRSSMTKSIGIFPFKQLMYRWQKLSQSSCT